jgi:hypothetical protein
VKLSIVNRLVIVVLASFFSACTSEDTPENLISQDVMAEVLLETHILESKVGRLNMGSYDSSRVAFQYLQKRIWDKYGLDSLTYTESYEYYAKYPKSFSKIYDKIEVQFSEMEKAEEMKEKKDTNE